MAETKLKYNNIATAVAITSFDSLGNGAWCSSALVDNQTNLFMDVLIGGSLQTGTVTTDGTIDLYVAGSWDGVEFTGGVDAGDGVITWGTTGNTTVNGESMLRFLGSINVDANDDNKDMVFGPFSIAAAFGGVMPLEWCIVVENNIGDTTNATGANNHLEYTGITFTTA